MLLHVGLRAQPRDQRLDRLLAPLAVQAAADRPVGLLEGAVHRRAPAGELHDVERAVRLDDLGVQGADPIDRERRLRHRVGDHRLALGALGGPREEAEVAEAIARLGVGVVLLGERAVEPQIVGRGEELREDAARGPPIAQLDVAGADLLGRVELGAVRLVVRAHVGVRDLLGAALIEALLEEAPDHHLFLGALDLRQIVVAPPLGLLREELEADHLVEELAPPLGAAVAGADERALRGQLVGEVAERDVRVADLHEGLRRLRLGQPVDARRVIGGLRAAGVRGLVLAAARRREGEGAAQGERGGDQQEITSLHRVECLLVPWCRNSYAKSRRETGPQRRAGATIRARIAARPLRAVITVSGD